MGPTDQLVDVVAAAAAEVASRLEPRRLPLCVSYEVAGNELGISVSKVRSLVAAGVLVRPEWSRTEVRAAVVTTASLASAAGWPVVALEVAVPAA